jgi:hypothetical protein
MIQTWNAPLQSQVERHGDQLHGTSASVRATKASAIEMTRIMKAVG